MPRDHEKIHWTAIQIQNIIWERNSVLPVRVETLCTLRYYMESSINFEAKLAIE